MGHLRVYTIGDVLARFERLRADDGVNVIFPMGWDAFGLPAENAAIDRGLDPETWTYENIASMKKQLMAMASSFDWDRELMTCDPDYYKWTQFIFLKLYEAGLVYRKDSIVNWDPVDKTVLANEQVDAEGRAERSGAIVEKRKLEQWFVKITDYAEDLLRDIDVLDWPAKVKQSQTSWIGRVDGFEVTCQLRADGNKVKDLPELTIFGSDKNVIENASYVAIPFDSWVLDQKFLPTDKAKEVLEMAQTVRDSHLSPFQKGLLGCHTGLYIQTPKVDKKLPIYLAGFIPSEFASGAFFCAPEHDTRHKDFAGAHGISESGNGGGDMVSWDMKQKTYYRLRDWLISRQRFWGTPVPIIHCSSCGPVPVPEDQLPVKLPKNVKLQGRGGSPLASCEDWVKCECPKCKSPNARRDTDTMDTFVDSSWYWLRYLDPKNDKSICDPLKSKSSLPVDVYVGGVEHSILHLLYARFIGKFLQRSGYASGDDMVEWKGEPFITLLAQGMVNGKTFKCPDSGRYLKPDEVDSSDHAAPKMKDSGKLLTATWEKMSKSKFNGVDPSDMITKYGADCTRLYMLYKSHPSDELTWEEHGIVGMERWLARCFKVTTSVRDELQGVVAAKGNVATGDDAGIKDVVVATHTTIKEVTGVMTKSRSFNTALASLIKLTRSIEGYNGSKVTKEYLESVRSMVTMVAPFAPCAASEMWEHVRPVGDKSEVWETKWPVCDENVLKQTSQVCVIMVNGKARGHMKIDVQDAADHAKVEQLGRESEVGVKWLKDKKVVKVLVLKEGT
ncbi:hypothetical protein HDU76_002844, partial [Blyttiomyces sp. JEL0837]